MKKDRVGCWWCHHAGFLLLGRELEMSSSLRIGLGYFPPILSLLMIGLGAVMLLLA